MSANAKSNEPSMDEILASIRRIIADDDPMPRRPERAPEPVSRRPPMPQARMAAPPVGQSPGGPSLSDPLFSDASLSGDSTVREHSFAAEPATELMKGEDMADYPYQGAASSQPATARRPEPVREPTAPRPVSVRPPEPTSRAPAEPARRKDLLSPDVDAAVIAAFESLGDAVLPARERTIEDLVKEILRPMLKTWLDDNLPRIVERQVRQEIERISRTSR